MGLDKEIRILLNKINRQGIESIAAAFSLKLLIAAGFLTALLFLRSYSVDFCLRTLQEETREAQRSIYQQISFTQGRLEMLAGIIEDEEEITSERVLKMLQPDTDAEMISRLGIVLPDNRIFNQDGTWSEPVNGITFDALAKRVLLLQILNRIMLSRINLFCF